MVTRTGRRRGQELYNNYGRKSNEEFILGYGFALASNPYDFVRVAPAARGVSGPDAARRDRLRTELGLNGAHYLMRRDPLPENLLSAVRVMVMPEAQVCAMLRGVGAGAGAGESGEKVIGGAGEASGGAGEGAAEAVAVGGKRSDGGGSALGIGAGDDEDYANAINAFATVVSIGGCGCLRLGHLHPALLSPCAVLQYTRVTSCFTSHRCQRTLPSPRRVPRIPIPGRMRGQRRS